MFRNTAGLAFYKVCKKKNAIYYNCRFKFRIILTAAELQNDE